MHKTPKDTYTTMSEMVLPNDTNTLGNLLGGRLMYWMDIAAVIAAMKHSNCPVVTVSADSITFEKPAHLGDIVTIEAVVTRAFNTSIEVYIKVYGENLPTQYKYLANEAYLTFVAIDPHGKPKKIPQITPETVDETKLFDEALQRRQMRLLMAGRIKPEDASELKKLYK
ncbi:MAG TPA: acyl-CoA thioesterase [Chitinophagaceae bacterium]|nr:acyl-CoA thioesterase [Chitinophagaceae bacterium]